MDLETMEPEEIEAEALKQGFNPNFEGENKKTPKEFLEVAFNHNHVLKERNEKLSEQFTELKTQNDTISAELNKQRDSTAKLIKFQEDQKKKAVDKAVKALKIDRTAAIKDGDAELVEQIDKEIDSQKEEAVAVEESSPAFNSWVEKNKWYNDDPTAGAEADYYAKMFVESGRFKTEEAVFEAVTNKIRNLYPEKFTNPKKDDLPEVEGGRNSPSKKSKKSYEDLPTDAKKACDEFVADGIMKQADYVAMYEWE